MAGGGPGGPEITRSPQPLYEHGTTVVGQRCFTDPINGHRTCYPIYGKVGGESHPASTRSHAHPAPAKTNLKRTLTHAFDDVKRYHQNYQKAIVERAQAAARKEVARTNRSRSQQQAVHQARGEA